MRRLIVILFCLFAQIAPAQAQVPALANAARLIEAGQTREARPILLAYQPRDLGEQVARLRLLARAEVLDGAPRAAARWLDQLVTLVPGNPVFRYDLAVMLSQAGNRDRARFHFLNAMAGDLPPSLRAAAEAQLQRLDDAKTWGATLSFGIAPETNPYRRTASESVVIGGVVFDLDDAARQQAATALQFSAGAFWEPVLADDLRGRLAVASRGRFFGDADLNDLQVGVEAGLVALGDRGRRIGAGFKFQYRTIGGDPYYHGPGAYLSFQTRLGRGSEIVLRLDVDDHTFPDLPGRDGPRFGAALAFTHLVSPRLALRAGLSAARTEAAAPAERATEAGVSLGAQYLFERGLIASIETSFLTSRRDARSALFPQVRQDDRWSVTLGLRHRSFTVRGMAPTFEIGFEQQDSTVPLYRFDNLRLAVGLTRNF